MATKTKKPTAAKSTAPLPPPVASVELVPLDRIDVLPQVRTEFDQESLQELAQDIQARGLLQPVLLNPHLDRFTLIAGERRLRACRLAGLAAIPALITKASAEKAEDIQLAENVQREQLNLADTAKAVRRLFDRLGSLQAVADRVKKSRPWVSKHLAVTCAGFCWTARRLLEDGVSEDLRRRQSMPPGCRASPAKTSTRMPPWKTRRLTLRFRQAEAADHPIQQPEASA